ncbi:MAG: hypothetical protein BJ554DRAFT_103, partial [Olpidium bornovanus]
FRRIRTPSRGAAPSQGPRGILAFGKGEKKGVPESSGGQRGEYNAPVKDHALSRDHVPGQEITPKASFFTLERGRGTSRDATKTGARSPSRGSVLSNASRMTGLYDENKQMKRGGTVSVKTPTRKWPAYARWWPPSKGKKAAMEDRLQDLQDTVEELVSSDLHPDDENTRGAVLRLGFNGFVFFTSGLRGTLQYGKSSMRNGGRNAFYARRSSGGTGRWQSLFLARAVAGAVAVPFQRGCGSHAGGCGLCHNTGADNRDRSPYAGRVKHRGSADPKPSDLVVRALLASVPQFAGPGGAVTPSPTS